MTLQTYLPSPLLDTYCNYVTHLKLIDYWQMSVKSAFMSPK